jgi:hypothetical protein
LVIVVLAQRQIAINISALPVSLGPISVDLDAPATAVATALAVLALRRRVRPAEGEDRQAPG